MDSVICVLSGFLLCCSYALMYFYGKSQAVPPVYLQWDHEQQLLSEVLSKEGVAYTQEQLKRISEDITDYQKKAIGFHKKREDADE